MAHPESKNWESKLRKQDITSWWESHSTREQYCLNPTWLSCEVASFCFRKFYNTIGAYSTNLNLMAWKCNIPHEKRITEMVTTASSRAQLVLQSLALCYSQLCYCESLGLYSFWVCWREICLL